MPARNIQIAAVVAIVAVVAVVIAVTQFSAGSDDTTPTAVPTGTAVASPVPSPTASSSATPGPTETPTPTPSPTPSPTPEPPDPAFFAILLLANEMDALPEDFTVRSYEEATWPAADYGCPAPGMLYAQSEVNGWDIEIEYQGQVFEFHSDAEDVAGETLVNCTANSDLMEDAVNIVELAGLRSATQIEMLRRNGQGTYDLKNTVTDPEQIETIVDALDVPVTLGPAASCTPVFQLIFSTPSGSQTLGAICGGNSRLIRGDQGFWNGMDGAAAQEFSSIIGPYFSDEPLPVPPTASPTATGQ